MLITKRHNNSNDNTLLLHTLINSHKRAPLIEQKSILNMTQNKLPSKISFTENSFALNTEGAKIYTPKTTTAISLRNFLKKQVVPTKENKSRGVNKTCITSQQNNLMTNAGSVTQRKNDGQADLKITCRISKGISPSSIKSNATERLSFKENLQPLKNIQIPSNTEPEIKCCGTEYNYMDNSQYIPLKLGTAITIPNHEPSKCSAKNNGTVKAYAANTNQGIVRYFYKYFLYLFIEIIMKTGYRLF